MKSFAYAPLMSKVSDPSLRSHPILRSKPHLVARFYALEGEECKAVRAARAVAVALIVFGIFLVMLAGSLHSLAVEITGTIALAGIVALAGGMIRLAVIRHRIEEQAIARLLREMATGQLNICPDCGYDLAPQKTAARNAAAVA